MWHLPFSDLLNSVHNAETKDFVNDHVCAISPEITIAIATGDVLDILKEVKVGKAVGLDNLAAEHFVFAHCLISVYFSLLFTCPLYLSYIPHAFMKTLIIPITNKYKLQY